MHIQRVKDAIEEIKNGNMVIMIDDEDRENEGDLVYASTFSTPEKVNFLASEAKGLICVALSNNIANKLHLNPMVTNNDSSYETAFTVSVDAKECETGISAYERDLTIKLLASPIAKPSDLVRPGHIFPLIAKDGGTLVRTGHTEGSVDLCKLAGISHSAVICEIMKKDGTMARRDDLEIFAKEHDMKIVYISDIVEYRMQSESLIKVIGESNTIFLDTPARKIDFIDHNESHHTAFIFKNKNGMKNVRFHNISLDIELFTKKGKFEALMSSVEILKKEGGVLIFLEKSINANRYMKEYGIGAQILKYLGFSDIKLLTTHKGKEFVGISGFGLNVIEEVVL
jgi:3,4-dihydroxy 2-butanone 4-phosphate synthase/GTP cyclohydrolase II